MQCLLQPACLKSQPARQIRAGDISPRYPALTNQQRKNTLQILSIAQYVPPKRHACKTASAAPFEHHHWRREVWQDTRGELSLAPTPKRTPTSPATYAITTGVMAFPVFGAFLGIGDKSLTPDRKAPSTPAAPPTSAPEQDDTLKRGMNELKTYAEYAILLKCGVNGVRRREAGRQIGRIMETALSDRYFQADPIACRTLTTTHQRPLDLTFRVEWKMRSYLRSRG